MEPTNKITAQRLNQSFTDSIAIAEKYYNLLSTLNNLRLTTREVELIAFSAIKGNMSYANFRKEFCEKYGTSSATINNMISRLKRLGVFVKDGTKVKVNPAIVLNFENDIVLQITLKHG